MSIGIVIKGPEGLVLAAESRLTFQVTPQGTRTRIPVSFDNARKVLQFDDPHNYVGVVTYGLAGIGLRSVYSFIPEFESSLASSSISSRISIADFAQELSNFFMHQWNSVMPQRYRGPSITFVIGGFNAGEPYGRVYLIEIPRSPTPVEQHANVFGITWGGQREIVDRLIRGYDERAIQIATQILNLNQQQIQQLRQAFRPLQMQMPVQILSLQDCVDLAILFVRTTIEAQRLTVGIRGCGGPIDVATITRSDGFRFLQQKQIVGER